MDTKHFIEFVRNICDRGLADKDIALAIEDAYTALDLNPHIARERSKALQVQRQGRGGNRRRCRSHDFVWRDLGPWAAQSQSSIAMIEGAQQSRDWVEEIAIEATQLVETKSMPVAWALNILPEPGDGEEPRRYTAQDIVAQFCLQFLRQNQRRHRQHMLQKCFRISQEANTEVEWFEVFASCIEGLDEVYLILDLDVMDRGTHSTVPWPALFDSMSKTFDTSDAPCVVKAILFTCAIDLSFRDLSGTKVIKLPRSHNQNLRRGDHTHNLLSNPKPGVTGAANTWLQNVGKPRVKRPRSPDRIEGSEISGDLLDMRSSKRMSSFMSPLLSGKYTTIHPPASQSPRPANRNAFKVAIICALPFEADAIQALFDCDWDEEGTAYDKAMGDPNAYSAGTIGRHNIVLVHMSNMGTTNAAAVAASCRSSFPNIRLALVVGVCGGVPFPPDGQEMMLGDVVVSDGVIQYDLGRRLPSQFLIKDTLSDSLGRPNAEVRALLAKLRGVRGRRRMEKKVAEYLDVLSLEPELAASPPKATSDKLFEAAYHHAVHDLSCEQAGCNGKLVQRARAKGDHHPVVHFGHIASANTVMKSAEDRDMIAAAANVIAFEMEGAGVWDVFPCVVIKGVCDYADSHKNKQWQLYAAASAASCAKAFLDYWVPSSDI